MIVFASDLDNTLIYSQKKMEAPFVCVEWKDGEELSYMTQKAWNMLNTLRKQLCFVPVTTRSIAQYNRIVFPGGQPEYALVSNGGILLVKGEIEKAWQKETMENIHSAWPELEKAKKILENDKNVSFEIRLTDQLFLFTKSADIQESTFYLNQLLNTELVCVESMGEKLYVLPQWLTKGTALKRLRERIGKTTIYAAGDSSFDIDLLLEADYAIAPQKTEILDGLQQCRNLKIYPKKDCYFSETILEIIRKGIEGMVSG